MAHIDLTVLPEPIVEGLDKTLDEEHAEQRALALARWGWRIPDSPADPAWRVTRLFAARLTAHRGEVRDAMRQATLAYATGHHLDHIGVTYYQSPRLAGESDDDYRERLAHVTNLAAVGLSAGWYESIARNITGVADAHVTSPSPGAVTIFVLADETVLAADGTPVYGRGIPNDALLAAVGAAAREPDAAQQTDVVTVTAATRQRWDAAVTLTLDAGAAGATILADARVRLARYGARTERLNVGVSKALVAGAAASADGITDASVVLSTVSEDQVPVVTAVEEIAAAAGTAPEPRTLTVST